MTYEDALWLAHEVLVIATCGWLLGLVAYGCLRDRREAQHERRRNWHGR